MSLRARLTVGAGLLLVLIGGPAQARDACLGVWKLNLAKSGYQPGSVPQGGTTRLERLGDGAVKVTSDGVDAAGQATRNEIVTRFDGKPIELKGTTPPVTLAFSRVDDHHYDYVTRVDGKVVATSRVSISADGKTRTVLTSGTSADGKPMTATIVYDRQ